MTNEENISLFLYKARNEAEDAKKELMKFHEKKVNSVQGERLDEFIRLLGGQM